MSHLTKLMQFLLVLTGLIPAAIAVTAMVGLGVIRQGFPPIISVGAVGVALLPAVAVAGLAKFRPEALAAGLWVWSIALLIGLPTWFPGERGDAIVTGAMWFGALGGEDGAESAAAFGERVAGLLGEELFPGTLPGPELTPEPEEVEPPPPPRPELSRAQTATVLTEDQVVLPYEGQGRSLRVPVSVDRAGGGDEEIWMLFDTGATFTTLNEATLYTLGIDIPRDAPEVTLQTAGGERTAKLVLLDRIWLGGFPVEGVTVAICEPCSDNGVAGLLGLNVSGQFQVTLDHDQQEMVLKPRSGTDRHLDVGEWLDVNTKLSAWTDGRMDLMITTNNLSNREIRNAEVAIQCPEKRFTFTIPRVKANALAEEKVSLPRNTECPEYRVSLERASW